MLRTYISRYILYLRGIGYWALWVALNTASWLYLGLGFRVSGLEEV